MLQPPIIVDAKCEVLLFRSMNDAAAYMEAVDVRNGEYGSAYDSEGRLIGLRTKSIPRRILGLLKVQDDVVELEPLESEPNHAEQLVDVLRRHVAVEPGSYASQSSLQQLVEDAIARFGYTT